MKTTFTLLFGFLAGLSAAATTPPVPQMDKKHRALFKEHCLSCHGPEKQKGMFRVDDLPFTIADIETAERWQKILNALNSGEMPPEDETPLPNEAKTDFLDDLSNVMVAARRSLSDQGGVITMRRLNRREYQNTLRALLGVDINVADLPSDTGSGSFDTVGSDLFMSANQFEQYQALGLEAIEEAFAWHATETNKKPSPPNAKATIRIHSNRLVSSISAKGLSKIRFECETANEKVSAHIAKQKDDRNRAESWKAAVEAAAALPENRTIVEALRKASKNDAIFRRSWKQIKGAPSPESFGFTTKENNADKANRALGERIPQTYHEYYMTRPALDRGAYLGTTTMHPSSMALCYIQLPVPGEWKNGDYVLRVCVGATADARPEDCYLEAGMHPRNGQVRATFAVSGTLDAPNIVEMPFTLSRIQNDSGDRTLFIRQKGAWDNNEEGGRKLGLAIKRNGIGPEAVLWIDYMEIERLSDPERLEAPGLTALRIPLDDASPEPAAAEVHAAIQRFTTVAFRGVEPPASFQQRLATIYNTERKAGAKYSTALKETLSIVLSSPMFLYLAEPSIAPSQSLSPSQTATRLSYFVWGAPPDETLLKLARSGDLMKPDVLAEQTTRLLDDPRSQDLVHGLLYQWLGMDRLDFFEVNRAMYPRFDDSTKLAAKNEVYETFAHMLRSNAPLSDLLKADYAVINQLLADFYGIPGVTGDAYQKVSLPANSPRGGLLGMAAINFMGGNGERSNPVERGAWVLRKLLNDPPPPAPANVPQIARLAGQALTTRERLHAHQEEAQCASCHRKIDPIGFGLENFDPVGQWRTEDTYQVKDEKGRPVKDARKTWQIEASAALHKGPGFQDYFELRDIIASKSDDFAEGFSEALIEYALGRPIGFRDEPLIAEMIATAEQEKLGVRAFVQALVASEEFHTK